MDLVALDGVGERAHDVLLADDVGERARAVATVERGRGRRHDGPVYDSVQLASPAVPKPPQLLLFGALTVVGALLAWAMVGTGFANYDTVYSLVWGADLAHGRLPDYDVPVAPTPHPLATLAGLVLAPLGAGAETAVVVGAFASLGALAALTFQLGAHWFGPAAGALAALVILTREPTNR